MNNMTDLAKNIILQEKPPEKKINQTGQLFYRYDCENHKYQFISPTIIELIGYTVKEINEIGLERLIRNQLTEAKNIYPASENNNGRMIEEKTLTNLIETKDGELKWIEDNSITVNVNDGKSTLKFGTLKDVTANMRDEKIRQIISEILEASNSEKNLKELFKFIHGCIKKLMKADNFYIAYHKKDSDTLAFPYFVDEVDTDESEKKMGKGLTEYVLRIGRPALVDVKMEEELKLKGEVELIGPQSPIWLGVPLKIGEETIGVMVVQDYNNPTSYGKREKRILDVISYPISRAIERKMVEEEREEMIKKLQELNRSKDQLFSLISHDLRSPFNSLLGFAEILTTEFDSLTQRDIKEYLNVINDSAKTLFGMTNNLLHYSRLQLKKFNFQPKQINLYETVLNLTESLKHRTKKKDLLIKIEINDEYFVYADEEMLNILLENLIVNSIKYSNISSIIKLHSEKIINSESNKSEINLTIRDKGVGISEDNLLKIKSGIMYSTFGTDKESGLGLGLLLSEKFVEIHNGKMEIDSKEGDGTSITLILPANKE
ncbi:MAG: GAF domain-containing sensor histidine kinase [Ignavibacteria bacterium]|nr:GAF domain-containing sensor histidine kinase [Ignavibacteria bacterium]NNJ51803.1 GAF domain-containing sensor histidine kinase [Ignavibacteriaceae bacterium]NNL21872.1 GAF domain-containing sensor histidine kinase [Ignavibacteriaceae bacterium]